MGLRNTNTVGFRANNELTTYKQCTPRKTLRKQRHQLQAYADLLNCYVMVWWGWASVDALYPSILLVVGGGGGGDRGGGDGENACSQ